MTFFRKLLENMLHQTEGANKEENVGCRKQQSGRTGRGTAGGSCAPGVDGKQFGCSRHSGDMQSKGCHYYALGTMPLGHTLHDNEGVNQAKGKNEIQITESKSEER